ncbi:FMN-dependent dehydrogenase [Dactylonectria estremocensis]|uniref:FMN-dependent dehydrogenase n=1 Tax=Dactylonectria estremocensis TaxID=1079267 RepID=A0A9P9FEN6_9HYPO|nr:FMN-dependent dehydrogenase [Dactylonectria estremocensis]
MSVPSDQQSERRPPYHEYLFDIYRNKLLCGNGPVTTTDPNLLEEEAKKAMSPEGFNYVYGGASEGSTMDANRLAFRQWKLIPRMMRPTLPRDLRVNLFGETYESPVLMAPVGVQSAYHQDKEMGLAAACAELSVPFIISTASTSSIEEIATAGGPQAPRWFQLYWPRDNDVTLSLLRRARDAGCSTLVVTLDTFTMAWRPRDLDIGFLPFPLGQGNAIGFSDPVFRRKFAERTGGGTPEDDVLEASRQWIADVFSGYAHHWEDLALLREHWDGSIVLKGIMSADDARLALKFGMDGVVVSNHGGRQLDGAMASLDMLPEIVEAVGDKMTVIFDSGIRTGADVMKALCLGAKAVLVGRPVIYGLGIAGRKGAKHVLGGLLADLDQSMGLAGVKTVAELERTTVRRIGYGGDLKPLL